MCATSSWAPARLRLPPSPARQCGWPCGHVQPTAHEQKWYRPVPDLASHKLPGVTLTLSPPDKWTQRSVRPRESSPEGEVSREHLAVPSLWGLRAGQSLHFSGSSCGTLRGHRHTPFTCRCCRPQLLQMLSWPMGAVPPRPACDSPERTTLREGLCSRGPLPPDPTPAPKDQDRARDFDLRLHSSPVPPPSHLVSPAPLPKPVPPNPHLGLCPCWSKVAAHLLLLLANCKGLLCHLLQTPGILLTGSSEHFDISYPVHGE